MNLCIINTSSSILFLQSGISSFLIPAQKWVWSSHSSSSANIFPLSDYLSCILKIQEILFPKVIQIWNCVFKFICNQFFSMIYIQKKFLFINILIIRMIFFLTHQKLWQCNFCWRMVNLQNPNCLISYWLRDCNNLISLEFSILKQMIIGLTFYWYCTTNIIILPLYLLIKSLPAKIKNIFFDIINWNI